MQKTLSKEDVQEFFKLIDFDTDDEQSLQIFIDFANVVAAAEREACAKILDEMAAKDKLSNYYQVAAIAIRARG